MFRETTKLAEQSLRKSDEESEDIIFELAHDGGL